MVSGGCPVSPICCIRMWNGEPLPVPTKVRPAPQSRRLARWPPQARTTVGPLAVKVMLILRSTVPGVLTPIGAELTYAAFVIAAPHAEKSPGAWLAPGGNVVALSVGTRSLLGVFPQACVPAVPAMPLHGTIC